MQKQFQHLNLEKFTGSVVMNTQDIYGGATPNAFTNENLASGGATCSTPGGEDTYTTWTSDTAAYDGEGNLDFSENHQPRFKINIGQ